MEYEIRVYIAMYATYEVRVTHLGGANRTMRVTDASDYVMTTDHAEETIRKFQKKYSVPAERTFWIS